jgi:hypothetical protein
MGRRRRSYGGLWTWPTLPRNPRKARPKTVSFCFVAAHFHLHVGTATETPVADFAASFFSQAKVFFEKNTPATAPAAVEKPKPMQQTVMVDALKTHNHTGVIHKHWPGSELMIKLEALTKGELV